MQRRKTFNPKRAIRDFAGRDSLEQLAQRIRYGGNPEHKRNPGDFGLVPPAQPRADKTLCDEAGIFTKELAERLLKDGALNGLISDQMRGDFPQNIWVVTQDGIPLEAELENQAQGTYHGYPMPSTDPFRNVVLERWKKR